MKIKVQVSASRDLVEAYKFYQRQGEGLGAYFLDSIWADIGSLQHTGGIHPIVFERYHRMVNARFPFAIYYHVEEDVVIVRAVLDCRRKPSWIRERLA